MNTFQDCMDIENEIARIHTFQTEKCERHFKTKGKYPNRTERKKIAEIIQYDAECKRCQMMEDIQ